MNFSLLNFNNIYHQSSNNTTTEFRVIIISHSIPRIRMDSQSHLYFLFYLSHMNLFLNYKKSWAANNCKGTQGDCNMGSILYFMFYLQSIFHPEGSLSTL